MLAAALTGLIVPSSAYSIPGMWPASLFNLNKFKLSTLLFFGFFYESFIVRKSPSNRPLSFKTFFWAIESDVFTSGLRITSKKPLFNSMVFLRFANVVGCIR